MSVSELVAVIGALALAALLGAGDAPNALAALVSGRTRSYSAASGWSVGWHLAGGLVAGTFVARTTVGLVQVPPALLTTVLACGCWASVLFTVIGIRLGLPASASVALVGGLTGGGLAAAGWGGVNWGGIEGWRPAGVIGVLFGILLAPLVGGGAALLLQRLARPASLRLRRVLHGPIRAAVWAASAGVAVADGSNDGQKAMGVLTAALLGAGALAPGGQGVTWPARIACSLLLAGFTVIGGKRVVITVARRLSRSRTVDDLTAQTSSAAVILLAVVAGLPLSTSTVVTSARVGAAVYRRPRHLYLQQVMWVMATWLVTLPVSAIAGATLFEMWRLVP